MDTLLKRTDYRGEYDITDGGAWYDLSTFHKGYVCVLQAVKFPDSKYGQLTLRKIVVNLSNREEVAQACVDYPAFPGEGGKERKISIVEAVYGYYGGDQCEWDTPELNERDYYDIDIVLYQDPIAAGTGGMRHALTTEQLRELLDAELWAES